MHLSGGRRLAVIFNEALAQVTLACSQVTSDNCKKWDLGGCPDLVDSVCHSSFARLIE